MYYDFNHFHYFPFSISLFILIYSHDMDNILLENVGDTRTLQAVFELEALVLTGTTVFSQVWM